MAENTSPKTPTLAEIIEAQNRLNIKFKELQKTMSAIAQQLNQVQADLTEAQTDVTTLAAGITALNATITNLESSAAGDSLSPATQAILTNLVTQGGQLQTSADAAAAELPPASTA